MIDDRSDLEFEAVILVTRGDELPKKNYEKKRHPTYETSIRIKHTGKTKVTKPHLVIKFFNQYRDLYDALVKVGIGENLKINIDVPFPPSYKSSYLGVSLTEDQLQERCYMLNKWMQAIFQNYPLFPPEGQTVISEFLSLEDNDEVGEANKELILSLLRRKQESRYNNNTLVKSDSQQNLTSFNSTTETTAPGSPSAPSNVTGKPTSSNQSTGGGVRFAVDVTDNCDKPSLRLGENSPMASNKQNSSKFSVYSEAPMLSGAEMEEYSQESFVNSFLAVSVLRGDMIPKADGDSKLHHSYETIIRVVPFQDVILDVNVNQEDIDIDFYSSKIATVPPISFMKVFDGYRQLMTDLEALGIFPKDHAHKAQAYDEDDNTRRRAIVVDAPFPKTFRRSSIGIGLTENQLQVRVVMLNNWMGYLLRAFNTFPGDAQQVILSFLGITAAPSKLSSIPAFPEDGGDLVEYANATFYNILKGTFVLPKKKVELPPPPPSSTTKGGSHPGKKDKDEKLTANYSSEPQPLKTITWINGINQHPAPAYLGPADGVTEYVVNTFLGVKVTQGEKMLRKAGDSKLHSAYEVRIRILTYGELSNPEKIDMDADAYQRLASLPPFTLSRVFDGYRTLMRQLEDKRVFSKDRIESANSIGGSVLLDAVFPPTYGKSSLGIGLTETEKLERATKLNHWMAALLTKYAHCTPEAQEIIHSFLGLEEDNPAEPANKYIHTMLMKSYRPMEKPRPLPENTGKKANKGSTNTKAGKNSSSVPGDGKVDAGCACIIS